MSASPIKRGRVRLRREIAHRLFSLGLSLQDAATAMGVDLGTSRHDYDALGGSQRFPISETNITERRKKAFWQALVFYGKLNGSSASEEDVYNGVKRALEKYLDIVRLRGIAAGVASSINRFISPEELEKFKPHRMLLWAIFGFAFGVEMADEITVLKDYIEHISALPKALPSRESIAEDMAAWAIWQYKASFSTPLTKNGARAIEAALTKLAPREEKVIKMRFGIGQKRITLEEIAQSYQNQVSKEKVRQIEAKALRTLREPSNSRPLLFLVRSIEQNAKAFVESKFSDPAEACPKTVEEQVREDFLNKKTEELEISTRLYHALAKANVYSIRDLVQKGEAPLLRKKSLTKADVELLKSMLYDRGLAFGMSFTDDGRPISPEDDSL